MLKIMLKINFIVRRRKHILKNGVNIVDKVAEMNIVSPLSAC